jgi:hypothetical protein
MRLTPTQKERLLNRDKPEFASTKRSNDYVVRDALKDFLNLEDVKLILGNLPKRQIETVVTDKHIDQLLTLAEMLYMFIGPGDGPYYEVPTEEPSGDKKAAFVRVSEADKQRAINLQVHINNLEEIKKHREMRYTMFDSFETLKNNKLKVGFKRMDASKK